MVGHAAEVMVVISCDSALSKIHICLSLSVQVIYIAAFSLCACVCLCVCARVCARMCVLFLSCAHSPPCTWPGTWPCLFWVTITTSFLQPTSWTSPWALRHFVPSFPLSHTMGNRCVSVSVLSIHLSQCVLIAVVGIHVMFAFTL